MAIVSTNLKFMQSERMTDFPDGGGEMSANEIIDNQMNNVFADRSDLDAILGRVSLRECFLWVDTSNTDPLLGSFIFLSDPPLDPLVTIVLFDIGFIGVRSDARNYVENYRVKGVKSQFILYGDHFPGQKTIQVYCRTEIASPDIGDVLCLSIEDEDLTPQTQFVAVQEVALRTTNTFTDGAGDFQRDVLIIKITSELQFTFPGQQDPQRITGANPPATLIRLTQVADSAKYYGLRPITVNPVIGDLTVKVDDPYIPIVPNTTAETPVVDQLAGLGTISYTQSGAAASLTDSFTAAITPSAGVTRFLGTPFVPGSLSISAGAIPLRDDGHGNIVSSDGSNPDWGGSCDYLVGSYSVTRTSNYNGPLVVTATPAAPIEVQSYSQVKNITAATRDISYVFQLPGQVSPGSVIIDYRALGKWIRLYDDGRGKIANNPGEGSATISYSTGAIALTLGALPDIDSALIVSWGTDLRVANSSGDITIPTPAYRMQLSHNGVVPGTWSMSWLSGGVTKNATANNAGVLSGDATGGIDYSTGQISFTTAFGLDASHQFNCTYDWVDPSKVHSEVFTPSPSGHAVSIVLAHPPKANTVVATWAKTVPTDSVGVGQRSVQITTKDNGSGGWTNGILGTNTIDYSTGAITLTVDA